MPDYLGQVLRGYQAGQGIATNRLAGDAMNASGADRQSALGRLASVNPQAAMSLQDSFQAQDVAQQQQAKAQEVDHAKKINGAARFMLQAVQSKDPARIQGAWSTVAPYLSEVTGKPIPASGWDDSMLPGLYQTLAATGGMPQSDGTVVAPGGVLVDKSTGQAMYSNPSKPSNAQLVDIPDGRGGTVKMLFDPQSGQLAQPSFGQDGQAAPQWGQPNLDGINAQASQFVNSGQMTRQQAEAWLQQQYAKAGVPLTPVGGGLGHNPPKQAVTLSADEVRALGLPDGTVAQRDTNGKIDVVSRPPQVSQDKLADIAAKRQKAQQAQQDSVSTFNDSIGKIDALLGSGSFGELGTFTGDLATKIPHTGAADAKAQLDTIGNQSVINTLSALKSLSATGASGFGALSEKEGDILRNAAANLSTAQSNEALRQNLLDLRAKMVRARDRVAQQAIKLPEDSIVGQPQAQPQAGGVDDLLSKYGVQ